MSKSKSVSVTATTAIGKPTRTTGPISSLILPSSLVPYIWPTSPASFGTGVVVGLVVAFLRPTIEFYVDVGASYIAVGMRFFLIWGSVAFIAWAVLRILQQTSSATLVINPDAAKNKKKKPVVIEDEEEEEEEEDNEEEFKQRVSSSNKQKQQQLQASPRSQNASPSPSQQFQIQFSQQPQLLHAQQQIIQQPQQATVQTIQIPQQQQQQSPVFDLDQTPDLQIYEPIHEVAQIEYSYEQQRIPRTTYAISQPQYIVAPTTTTTTSPSPTLGGRSSAASVYSNVTTSSASSNGSSAMYYSPPLPQYNPYRHSPSPTPGQQQHTNEISSANSANNSRTSSPTRVPVGRKVPTTSTNTQKIREQLEREAQQQQQQQQQVSSIPARYNHSNNSKTTVTSSSSGGNRGASPIRRGGHHHHNSVEPRIVPLDEDDNNIAAGHSYHRSYPNRVAALAQQHELQYRGKENEGGYSVLEKPIGQSAFRLKKKM